MDILDAVGAIKNFPSRDEFWIALARVSVDADGYLRDYNASVVLYDQETRENFLRELNETRDFLASLNVKDAPVVLDELSQAVARKDSGSLIDGLRVFHAEMMILKDSVYSALTPTD
jgi:hypothetical protein